MKFRCNSHDLLSSLQISIRAISSRSTQPILEGVLVEALEDGLKLTASDGSFTSVTRVNAVVEVEGEAVLPGKLFSDVIRKMPAGEISASMNNAFMLTLKCTGSRTNIAGQSADSYPRVEEMNEENSVTLPQSLIKDMIQRISFAIPTEDAREVLLGGYFNMQSGQIDMVGLDGFRLAMRTERVSDIENTAKAIIPLKALEEIAKLMTDDEESMVTLKFGENKLRVDLEKATLYTRLKDGEYVNYKAIIPKTFKTTIRVSTDDFSSCVERAALMAIEGKNNLIKFSIEGDKLFVTSNSEMGDVFEELDVVNTGDDIVIAFNVKYLLEFNRVITGKEIDLKFNSPVSPCVISPAEGNDFTYLVLPVRINA